MFRIGTFVGMIGMLLAANFAFADWTVDCKNRKGQAVTTAVNYQIKATDSLRLATDIFMTVRGSSVIASTRSVAQYLSQANVLYYLVDDLAENRIFEFKARPNPNWSGNFGGYLSEIQNGQVVVKTRLTCTITGP